MDKDAIIRQKVLERLLVEDFKEEEKAQEEKVSFEEFKNILPQHELVKVAPFRIGEEVWLTDERGELIWPVPGMVEEIRPAEEGAGSDYYIKGPQGQRAWARESHLEKVKERGTEEKPVHIAEAVAEEAVKREYEVLKKLCQNTIL